MRVLWILSGRSITPLGFPKRKKKENNVGDEARRGQSTEIAIPIIFLNQLILIHEPLLKKNAEMQKCGNAEVELVYLLTEMSIMGRMSAVSFLTRSLNWLR